MSAITEDIRAEICKYFNENELLDCPFIQAPSNHPAPVGKYVAVKVEEVEQHGSEMQPPPGDNATFAFQQVATISFTEVEGDGGALRMVRNLVQRNGFRDSAGKIAGFSVWDFGNIIPVETFDGEFVVRQWRFAMRVNFADEITGNVAKIETVEPLTLTGE